MLPPFIDKDAPRSKCNRNVTEQGGQMFREGEAAGQFSGEINVHISRHAISVRPVKGGQ